MPPSPVWLHRARALAPAALRPPGWAPGGPRGRAAAAASRGTMLSGTRPAAVPQPATPSPDPFAGMACTGDLAADAAAELAALLAALTAPPRPAADVLDSRHYLVAYWPSRAAKDAWLTAAGLDALGDKYLDGDTVTAVPRSQPSGRAPAPVSPARPPHEHGKDQPCLTSRRRRYSASASTRICGPGSIKPSPAPIRGQTGRRCSANL